MDLSGFFFALSKDWITLMSGIFSVIFAILAHISHKRIRQFFGKEENQRRIFWGMALLCFFFASVRVWTDEHKKSMSETAYLQGKAKGVYDEPFIVNNPLRVSVEWTNVGHSPAQKPIPYIQGYVASNCGTKCQQTAIDMFKTEYAEELKKVNNKEYRWLFPGQTVAVVQDNTSNVAVLTDQLKQQIQNKEKTLFAISAIRFEDASGVHDAHVCCYLQDIIYKGDRVIYGWNYCDQYTTQIDIK